MQLYAFDEQNQITLASHAKRSIDYTCIECGSRVRLRGGEHRQLHFYHLNLSSNCRLGGKSLLHMQIQLHLQKLIGADDCELEKQFPQINRIGDVAWQSQKIIYEIQCSFITKQEVLERISDYRSIGWKVVWILHDQCFNQRKITAAEVGLSSHSHYYTNFDQQGNGVIYDQFSQFEKGFFTSKVSPFPIEITLPISERQEKLKNWQELLYLRRKDWDLYFSGDLISSPIIDFTKEEKIDFHLNEEQRLQNKRKLSFIFAFCITWLKFLVLYPYRVIFRILLQKICY